MKARAFPLAAACLLAITSGTAGQDVDLERESLAGLDGLFVLVEYLGDRFLKQHRAARSQGRPWLGIRLRGP